MPCRRNRIHEKVIRVTYAERNVNAYALVIVRYKRKFLREEVLSIDIHYHLEECPPEIRNQVFTYLSTEVNKQLNRMYGKRKIKIEPHIHIHIPTTPTLT